MNASQLFYDPVIEGDKGDVKYLAHIELHQRDPTAITLLCGDTVNFSDGITSAIN